jgi:hypothetical protein
MAHALREADRLYRVIAGTGSWSGKAYDRTRPPLSRKTLAALSAAAGQNLLTTCGQHALAEAVAALAHEAAWLISTFHGSSPTSLAIPPEPADSKKLLFIRGLNQNAGPFDLA